jgi:hypothetical protein
VVKSWLRTSRCRRFLPVFGSGIRRKSIAKPAGVLQAAGQLTCQNGVSIGVKQWQESTA